MNIDDYQFGRINVQGKTYTSDVIILPGEVMDGWWRKEGHNLQLEDLDGAIQDKPDMLVIGTGYFGRMAVPPDIHQQLKALGIDVITGKTSEAVKEFNRLQQRSARVVAALHLSC